MIFPGAHAPYSEVGYFGKNVVTIRKQKEDIINLFENLQDNGYKLDNVYILSSDGEEKLINIQEVFSMLNSKNYTEIFGYDRYEKLIKILSLVILFIILVLVCILWLNMYEKNK